jgi:hypothetical protein
MKRILNIITILILGVNSISGLILTSYGTFNWICADVTIIIGYFSHYRLNSSKASDGMKISLNFILALFSISSFCLAVAMPPFIKDNLVFVFLVLSISVQLTIAILPSYLISISKPIKQNNKP